MTDARLVLLGCGWLLIYAAVFAIASWKGKIRFDSTSMRLFLALVAWIGIASILCGIATQAQAFVFVIDLVVSIGLVVALCLAKD